MLHLIPTKLCPIGLENYSFTTNWYGRRQVEFNNPETKNLCQK